MSSINSYCPACGNLVEVAGSQYCANCSAPNPASASGPATVRVQDKWAEMRTGLLVWLGSYVLIVGFQVLAFIVYLVFTGPENGGRITIQMLSDPLFVTLTFLSAFPAHILTLLLCWLIVTRRGRRPFWQSLGWGWHPQFKWVHAVALAFLMLGLNYLLERSLPHQQTELEKLLKLGFAVRLTVAALAVLTAPLVEELVYRGVLYSGIERALGKPAAVAVVTILFAGVHYIQYRASIAVLTAIFLLSLVLTVLRAATGKLLPCVATHLVYNGIQAIALIAVPDQIIEGSPVNSALIVIFQSPGLS
jgi:uncharacterized protein